MHLSLKACTIVKMIMWQKDDNPISSHCLYITLPKMISKDYSVMIVLINYRCVITICIVNRACDIHNICT